MKPTKGCVLGRYELLFSVAELGDTTVWAARQRGSRGFHKTVAITTVAREVASLATTASEETFLTEARIAGRIRHPNVAETLDVGDHEGVLYRVTEWVDGERLSDIIAAASKRADEISPRLALQLAVQIAAALNAAHRVEGDGESKAGVLHPELLPENVLVTYDGIVKLLGFGAREKKQAALCLTPEEIRGEQPDARSDVFALGSMLYTLTTGVHPFAGEDEEAIRKNIVHRPAFPPRAKNDRLSVAFEQLLLRCLQKDPAKRYQSAGELERAIEKVLSQEGASLVDEDLGAWVKRAMSEEGERRRARIRDAVRAADDRSVPGVPPSSASRPSLLQPPPVVTDTSPDRASDVGALRRDFDDPPSSDTHPSDTHRVTESIAALAATEHPPAMTAGAGRPRSKGAFVLAAASAAVILLVALVRSGADSSTRISPSVTRSVSAGQGVAAPLPSPSPLPTQSPVATAAPTSEAAAIRIEDLPDVRPGSAVPAKAANKTKAARSNEDGSSVAPAWVPTVTNPGF